MTEATLVYDDDCGFCTWWAEYVDERTDVRLVGFSDLDGTVRERLPAEYEDCAHLVTGDEVYSCGASIEQALVRTDIVEPAGEVVDFLRQFDDYERFRKRLYRWVANNRDQWGKLFSRRPPARRGSDDT
ncbi:DCC1-like thiol-disulfide oxidoreductase family protein [Natrinema gelatinilyticum]|uniref:DCC1-like thiol-disulfide oxidoreductase family protein n=1 Tax=Natrinema gelatinilyticum TaxID=2961571 RepID=UPI0020C45AAC|nr:DCC1-like thiol-disulfide oxidoreductase family protein [Natrinema gelatinilyticum]